MYIHKVIIPIVLNTVQVSVLLDTIMQYPHIALPLYNSATNVARNSKLGLPSPP